MKNTLSNTEVLKLVKEAKAKAKKKQLTKISDKSKLSTEEKFKISLCYSFVQYCFENKLKPTDLHKKTGIEMSRLSEILHYKINLFSIEHLLKYLNVLASHSAKIKEHVKLLEQVMNTPVLTVKNSKKLTKYIREESKQRMAFAR